MVHVKAEQESGQSIEVVDVPHTAIVMNNFAHNSILTPTDTTSMYAEYDTVKKLVDSFASAIVCAQKYKEV
jgi:hypothetical protein